MPIGRLTKKIQCQPTLSVRKPPSPGPMRNEIPKTAPKRPWYLPRSAGVKRSPMTARAIGKRAPAPRPWMPRNRISCHISWLRPDKHRADEEQRDADHQHRPPAVEVGQLAVERDRDRARQEVDRDDPGVQVVATEIGDDCWQRGPDDRLIEGDEEQSKKDRPEDLELLPLAQPEGWVFSDAGRGPAVLGGEGFHDSLVPSCSLGVKVVVSREVVRAELLEDRAADVVERRREAIQLRPHRGGRGSPADDPA